MNRSLLDFLRIMYLFLTDRIKSQKEIYDSYPVNYSTPTLSPDQIYRPSSGRCSVDILIECRLSAGRVLADTVLVLSTLGRYLIDTLPIVCRYLTDTRTKSADQVDMSRLICRLFIAQRYLTFERRHKRDFQSI